MKPVRRAFTIIELLTVIAVIAILAGLLLPAINGARERAKAAKAKAEIKALQMAIQQYETTYGYLPVAGSADTAITGTAYTNLIGYLSGTNPRNLIFLELRVAGQYTDPWNNDYKVYLALDYDNKLTNANTGIVDNAGAARDILSSTAIYSLGANKTDNHGRAQGTGCDDINSWE